LLLFDSSVKWMISAGAPESSEPLGYWSLRDGSPTKTLGIKEYRDWVRENVTSGLIRWIVGAATVIGGAGAAFGYFGVPSLIKSYVHSEVKLEFDKAQEQLDHKASVAAGEKVIGMVFNSQSVQGELTKGFTSRSEAFVDEKLKDPKFQARL